MTRSGTTLVGLLTIAFVILKLCHVIDWSWWWVLAPLWIAVALAAVGSLLVLVFLWLVER